jgi:hypothetical protein
LTAVAVWDHKPTPGELLARRLETGWQPTPSRLKSGPAIDGQECGDVARTDFEAVADKRACGIRN